MHKVDILSIAKEHLFYCYFCDSKSYCTPYIPPVYLVLTQQELVLPIHGTSALTVLLTPPPSSVFGNVTHHSTDVNEETGTIV